jgi:hypothetical protein
MGGRGAPFLKQSFDILSQQTFKDFDVVISDHSTNNAIQELCTEYAKLLDIKYFRNNEKIGSSSANINNAIRKATGTLIKILFQDDFLYDKDSLAHIAAHFDVSRDRWHVTACESTSDGKTFFRPFHPSCHKNIHLGPNTISSPSVVTILNTNPLFFDENLIWYMDCDYYKRYYDTFGSPKILDEILIVNRVGAHQVSNTLATNEVRDREFKYILKKYKEKYAWLLLLIRKFRAYKSRR